MGKVTIKDVAREAGVSISTVSNTLNNSNLVNEKTKERVLEVIERLNYVPNVNGRLLKAGKSKVLGLVTASVQGPYFYVLVNAIYWECERRGYSLNILVSRDARAVMNNILGENMDGVFVFEGERIRDQEMEQIMRSNMKVLFLDRRIEGPNISSVTFNSYQAGYDATSYLIRLGHKKICYILGADDVYDSEERKRGYLAAMKEHGFEEHVRYLQGYFEEQFTYNSVSALFRSSQELPDAFVAGNDLSAVGCIKALQNKGYRVPEDVSVVGFDDIEIAEYFRPPLTTVRNPIARQGVLAVEMLYSMVADGAAGAAVSLDGTLIPRDSCRIRKMD